MIKVFVHLNIKKKKNQLNQMTRLAAVTLKAITITISQKQVLHKTAIIL
jgi:uncharacterized membrane protein